MAIAHDRRRFDSRPVHSHLRRLALAGAILAGLAGAAASPPASAASVEPGRVQLAAQTAAAEAKANIAGFRAAKFGMDEKAVRAAIKTDFGIEPANIQVDVNPIEKTTALIIKVVDMVPDSGPCQIVYILGYKSKKLIQVNIAWGAPLDPKAPADRLSTTGTLLRNYFTQMGFAADKRQADLQLPDGSLLMFRGQDNEGRQVLLQLSALPAPPAADASANGQATDKKPPPVLTLRLSYVEDPKTPDVFRLKEGSF
jgi:hypothetical protein